MTRIHYPKAKTYVVVRSVIPAGIVAFGVFGAGVYFWFKFDSEWMMAIAGILAVLLGGGLQMLIMGRCLAALPCPKCGKKDLAQIEIDGSNQLLVCSECKIEWDTAICKDIIPT